MSKEKQHGRTKQLRRNTVMIVRGEGVEEHKKVIAL
jgi:hypothetical protein